MKSSIPRAILAALEDRPPESILGYRFVVQYVEQLHGDDYEEPLLDEEIRLVDGFSLVSYGFDSFKVIAATFFDHETEILNFFDNRLTNASAESFNCKIKTFRAQLRGVSDIDYFLFRLQKIYA